MNKYLKSTLKYLFYPAVLVRRIYFIYWYCPRYPQKMLNKHYNFLYNRNINWEVPADLNEKILWLEFNTDTTIWSQLSDKYKVREYVKGCGLSHILVPLYGVWDKAEDIDFRELPNSFILKTNHGCGDNFVVNDKINLNQKAVKKEIKKALNKSFGVTTCEPHYLRIKPCVIAEELLPIDPSISSSIIDYKIWCFNGKPYCCLTCANRNEESHSVALNIYDFETWQPHPEYMTEKYRNTFPVPKPENLEELLKYAGILSGEFKQVRVDMYEIKGKIYFGEMTFTSMGGIMDYFTPEYLKELGDQFNVL